MRRPVLALVVVALGLVPGAARADDGAAGGPAPASPAPASPAPGSSAPASPAPASTSPSPAPPASAPPAPAAPTTAAPAKAAPAPSTPAPPPGLRTLVVITAAEKDDAPLATGAQHLLTAGLAKLPRLTAYDPSPRILGGAAATAAHQVGEGKDAFTRGRKAYDNLDLQNAADDFEDAVKAFTAGLPAMASPAPLVRALVFLGATRFLAGDQDGAHAAFVRAVLIDPDHQPDPTVFSPPLAKAFTGARVEVAARQTAPLTVVSHPAGADVYVDGHWRGVAPLTLESISVGPHVLVVSHRGYLPSVTQGTVTPAAGAPVSVSLTKGPGADGYARAARAATIAAGPQKLPKATGPLLTRLPVDRVILGRVVPSKKGPPTLKLTAYAPAKGLRVASGHLVLPTNDARRHRALAEFAAGWLPSVALEPKPLPPPPKPLKVPAFARTWWFWTATTVGAAVIAGTAVALSQGHPKGSGLIVLGIP